VRARRSITERRVGIPFGSELGQQPRLRAEDRFGKSRRADEHAESRQTSFALEVGRVGRQTFDVEARERVAVAARHLHLDEGRIEVGMNLDVDASLVPTPGAHHTQEHVAVRLRAAAQALQIGRRLVPLLEEHGGFFEPVGKSPADPDDLRLVVVAFGLRDPERIERRLDRRAAAQHQPGSKRESHQPLRA
jgi:hypothetical protein